MPADPDPDPAPITAGKLRTILARAFKSVEQADLRSIADTGLCLSDFAVLEVLLHKGPLPVNTIGAKVLLTSGSISTAIDRLEERRLVERVVDEHDRRVYQVHLTPSGKRLIQKAYLHHEKNLEKIMSPLDKAEQERLARLLKKLGKNIRAMPQPVGSRTQPDP